MRGGKLRARVAIERDQLDQGPVGDDDAGGMGRGMTIEAFEPLPDIEQFGDDRLVVAGFLQAGLGGDGLGQRHRVGGIIRHQLAEPVDLAVGHLQHAADVAEHGAGLKLTEGDDMGDAVGAITLAHIGDHLVAAVLAEIDVEVRHRDALRIEEALEQQPEADRIEVGDGERIGNERACA